MPSFTLGTASGTHAQRAISVSASLAFRTNQPELRGFTPRERTMSSLTILMQTLLWPSYMNPTMSPNNAIQLTGSACHASCLFRRTRHAILPPVADLVSVSCHRVSLHLCCSHPV